MPNEHSRAAPPHGRRLLSRRNLLKATAGAIAATATAGLYARYLEPFWFEVVERSLPVASLPASLAGARLVQLSDLHINVTDDEYLISAFRHVEALRPDILVITGDFMSGHTAAAAERVPFVLQHLRPARLATLACLGNHDYGGRWRDERCADIIARGAGACGVRVLRNELADVAGLQIVGLDDLWSPRFDGRAAIRQIDTTRPAIALCHNPDACDLPIWRGSSGWILAGHTHGGQCKPPGNTRSAITSAGARGGRSTSIERSDTSARRGSTFGRRSPSSR